MNLYISVAKRAVENYIKNGTIIEPPENLPDDLLKKKSGVFVTIMKNGELRGCIGTYLATKKNIAQEIIANAIAAATEDYRFGLITKEELPYLSYTVYILNTPEIVENEKKLDPKKYGIIVKTAPILSSQRSDVIFNGVVPAKSGLLLPDLEGIDTTEQQISIACQKGRINPKREKILIYRFTVEKHD
jgi:AmmeMemoRadiSam system protein A